MTEHEQVIEALKVITKKMEDHYLFIQAMERRFEGMYDNLVAAAFNARKGVVTRSRSVVESQKHRGTRSNSPDGDNDMGPNSRKNDGLIADFLDGGG